MASLSTQDEAELRELEEAIATVRANVADLRKDVRAIGTLLGVAPVSPPRPQLELVKNSGSEA